MNFWRHSENVKGKSTHLKVLFKPLTHPLARGEKSQQIKLKLSKKKNAQRGLTEEQENQGKNSF